MRGRRSVKHWTCEGAEWRYRSPFFQLGGWRVRRRNLTTGRVECISLDADSLTAARTVVQRMASKEAREGSEETLDTSTLSRALDAWLVTLDVRPATLEGYRSDVELYKLLLGGDRPVASITFRQVEDLFTVKWRDREARTKLKHRGLLVRFFDWANRAKLLRGNPARDVIPPRKWSRESSRAAQTTGQGLTLAEARKLLEACRGTRIVEYDRKRFGKVERIKAQVEIPGGLWWWIFITLRTGLRRSNVVGNGDKPGLCWKNLDLEKGILSIDGDQMKNGLPLRLPLHDELIHALKARLRELSRVPDPGERVVEGLEATQDLNRNFAAAVERAGFGDRRLRPHDLRHTFVSWVGASCTHSVMQRLAHHAARTITDKYGQHQELETLRGGLNSLPWLGARREEKGDVGA